MAAACAASSATPAAAISALTGAVVLIAGRRDRGRVERRVGAGEPHRVAIAEVDVVEGGDRVASRDGGARVERRGQHRRAGVERRLRLRPGGPRRLRRVLAAGCDRQRGGEQDAEGQAGQQTMRSRHCPADAGGGRLAQRAFSLGRTSPRGPLQRPAAFANYPAARRRGMKSKLVSAAERTFVLVLDPGDEALGSITQFALENELHAASFTAIGAFERATVGWFDLKRRAYRPIAVDEQCEPL